MLEINDLRVVVDGKDILKGVSLTVAAGEVHAIMGPNGSGKSTLAHVIAGRDGYTVTGGSVRFAGQDLLALEPEERSRAGVFLAFQYPLEIPGVGMATFLRTAVNAHRKHRGEAEMDPIQPLEDAWDLPGIGQHADRSLPVLRHENGAALVARRCVGEKASAGLDVEPEVRHEADPMHAPLKKRPSTRQRRIETPAVGHLPFHGIDLDQSDLAE